MALWPGFSSFSSLPGELISIYGQHEHQNLQRTDSHLDLLDRFADLAAEREAYRCLYQAMTRGDGGALPP